MSQNKNEHGNHEQPSKSNLHEANLGINLIVSTCLGGLAGYGLDKWLDTKPALLLLFIFLGFIAGMYQVWLSLNK